MILACLSNAVLVTYSTLYLGAFLVQLGFYAAALGGICTGSRVLRIPAFLLLVNLAILTAWFRYARGERVTSWNASERMRALPETSSRQVPRVRTQPRFGLQPGRSGRYDMLVH